MATLVRRAGSFRDADGRTTAWTVAEGRRGRRWRWATSPVEAGSLSRSFTLETAPDGTFVKLEAAAGARLLTLHREPDGSLHGNRVAGDGIRHLRFDAPAPLIVLAGWSPLAMAACIGGLPGGGGGEADGIIVTDDLDLHPVPIAVRRAGDEAWRVSAGDAWLELRLDADGLPVVGGGAWPLEGD